MGIGHSEVLLFVILIGAFADDDVVGLELLARVLPTRGEGVFLARVPVEPSRVIARRKIKSLLSAKHSRAGRRIVGNSISEAIDNAFDEGTIRRCVVRGRLFEPVGWITLRHSEHIAIEVVRARVLRVVQTHETEKSILQHGKA